MLNIGNSLLEYTILKEGLEISAKFLKLSKYTENLGPKFITFFQSIEKRRFTGSYLKLHRWKRQNQIYTHENFTSFQDSGLHCCRIDDKLELISNVWLGDIFPWVSSVSEYFMSQALIEFVPVNSSKDRDSVIV